MEGQLSTSVDPPPSPPSPCSPPPSYSAEGYGYSDLENACFACSPGCSSCSELSSCDGYCIDGWARTDASGKACSKVGA